MIKVTAPTAFFRDAKGENLFITWNDGETGRFPVRDLRLSCPCAACVNEWTGERMLDPAKVKADVKPTRLNAVGRYALAIAWSDGHRTGIYSYDYLKKIQA